jgi:voltage-gated potassium channel
MTTPPRPPETARAAPPPSPAVEEAAAQHAHAEREALLEQVSDLLERPLLALSFLWLLLVVVDLAGYRHRWLETLSWGIWGVFVFHILLEFTIAPRKGDYLQANWLTALALLLPALRLLRIARLVRALRAARAARGLRLLRVVSTANRGLRTARYVLARRGLPYVILINLVVLFLGAGGMYAFEQRPGDGGGGLPRFSDALWWTAMQLTTLGADYEPTTAEGRILAWLLALFAFSVFGYLTATLASLFVQQDQQHGREEGALPSPDEPPLRAEIVALREEVRQLRRTLEAGG